MTLVQLPCEGEGRRRRGAPASGQAGPWRCHRAGAARAQGATHRRDGAGRAGSRRRGAAREAGVHREAADRRTRGRCGRPSL